MKRSTTPRGLVVIALLGGALAGAASGCCSCPKTPTTGPAALAPGKKTSKTARDQRPNVLSDPLTLEELRAAGIHPEAIACNDRVVWFPQLMNLAKRAARQVAAREKRSLTQQQLKNNARVLLGYLVRLVFQYVGTQNLGAMRLKGLTYTDDQGRKHPLVVYRSGVTTDALKKDSCLRSLLGAGHVRHVVNLYAGSFPLHEFIKSEKKLCQAKGATHHDTRTDKVEWRELIKTPAKYEQHKDRVMRQVAKLIRERLLRPGGKPPRGNIYFHCGGGMHRSGMVFGILQRCINGAPMSRIEAEFKRHTAYRSPRSPGGFEKLNIRFIREFDCSLLGPVLPNKGLTRKKKPSPAG